MKYICKSTQLEIPADGKIYEINHSFSEINNKK